MKKYLLVFLIFIPLAHVHAADLYLYDPATIWGQTTGGSPHIGYFNVSSNKTYSSTSTPSSPSDFSITSVTVSSTDSSSNNNNGADVTTLNILDASGNTIATSTNNIAFKQNPGSHTFTFSGEHIPRVFTVSLWSADSQAGTSYTVGSLSVYGNNAPPSLQFRYPVDGATTALFSPWLLSAAHLNSTDYYQTRIQWYAAELGTSTAISGTNFNAAKFQYGADIDLNGISITRTDFGQDFATGTQIFAQAQLYDTQDPNNPGASLAVPIMIASTSIQFFLQDIPQSGGNFFVPSFVGTSTNATISTSTRPVGAVENPTFGLPGVCDATSTLSAWNASDWKCIIQNNLNDIIASTDRFGNGTINSAIDMVTNIFPLSVFKTVNADINAAEASSTTMDQGIDLHGDSGVFQGHEFVVISSSTTNWIQTQTGFDYKTFIDYILYGLLGVELFAVTIATVRSMGQ